jgi:hypothetical protein
MEPKFLSTQPGRALVALPAAAAMTAVDQAGLRTAIETVNPVESVVACWGYGWRGWGLYAGCLLRGIYPAPPPVYPAQVYASAPASAPPGRCWIDGSWRAC